MFSHTAPPACSQHSHKTLPTSTDEEEEEEERTTGCFTKTDMNDIDHCVCQHHFNQFTYGVKLFFVFIACVPVYMYIIIHHCD